MRRLFFGLEVSGEAREGTESVLARLTSDVVHQGTRWIRPEKLHLTLVFLGHVPEEKEAAISEAGRLVAGECGPLSLSTTELGGFPDLRRPKVVWLGVGESPELRDLQARLIAELSALVTVEDREYHPHLTLGRISPGSPKVGARVRELASELDLSPSGWVAPELVLFNSTADGRYEVVERYPFG